MGTQFKKYVLQYITSCHVMWRFEFIT